MKFFTVLVGSFTARRGGGGEHPVTGSVKAARVDYFFWDKTVIRSGRREKKMWEAGRLI